MSSSPKDPQVDTTLSTGKYSVLYFDRMPRLPALSEAPALSPSNAQDETSRLQAIMTQDDIQRTVRDVASVQEAIDCGLKVPYLRGSAGFIAFSDQAENTLFLYGHLITRDSLLNVTDPNGLLVLKKIEAAGDTKAVIVPANACSGSIILPPRASVILDAKKGTPLLHRPTKGPDVPYPSMHHLTF